MHHDPHPMKKTTGGGEKSAMLKAVAGKAGGRHKNNIGDDDMETAPATPSSMTTDKEDLFEAFANVTLHYDGET